MPKDTPINFAGIIGVDFFNKFKCEINFETRTLTVKSNSKIGSLNLTTSSDAINIVPPRVEKVCLCHFDVEIDGEYICPSQEIQPGVYIANTILNITSNYSYISIINSNMYPIDISKIKIVPEPINKFHVFSTNSWSSPLEQRLNLLEDSLNLNDLNEDEKISILTICRNFNDIFHLPGDTLTSSNEGIHDIPLLPNTRPINIKPYRLPQSTKQEINDQVNKMLTNGIIEPSFSPWNSPLLIVPKKSNHANQKRWRVVVDFRRLNDVTIADVFPLPNISDILDQLGKCTYFSTLDLADGYHQIPLNPADKSKTAFSTELGHYHFKRMPFGLKGAPSSFQRIMNNILTGLNGTKCFVYLDDIVVYGYDLKDHNNKLINVLNRIKKFNFKLQPTKCNFLRKEIIYLGHIITNKGIKPDPQKISAISNYPRPSSQKAIKSFIGFCSYYRRFIPNFSNIAEPLTKLLKKNIPFIWNAFCEEAFDKLRKALITSPILQYPDYEKTFIVTTDASEVAIGGVLSQDHESADLPIAYASRVLNKAERNYSVIERELLAIVWTVKRFRPYLYGRHFKIRTDHRPLVWLTKTKNPSSRLVRWRVDMDEYDYDVLYKAGKSNTNADALSRIIIPNDQPSTEPIVHVITRSQSKLPIHNTNSLQPTQLSKADTIPILQNSNKVQPILIPDLHSTTPLSESQSQNKIIYLSDENHIDNVIRDFHTNPLGGHQGITRTLQRIKCYYLFPRMISRIRQFIRKCEVCQKNKVSKPNKCPMKITTTAKHPFEKIFLDIVGPLPSTYENFKYILTMQDDLTKFSVAIPLKDQESDSVARAFVENFVCQFGTPESIVTDQGTNFMSQLFVNICKLLKIKKLRTTAYHPQSNGALERSHRTFTEYLRNFCSKDQMQWNYWLPFAISTFNSTPHSSTSYMPFELLYGFKPALPNSLKSEPEPYYNYDDYCAELKSKLQNCWQLARNNLIQHKEKSKLIYDKNINPITFSVNDKVLIKNELKAKKKIDSLWCGPYIIVEINSDENSTVKINNKKKVIHNNRLKLFIE